MATPGDDWADKFGQNKISTVIRDQVTEKTHECVITDDMNGIAIEVKGFKRSMDVDQVFVEVYEGKLRVIAWDGSQEDPVAIISIDPEDENGERGTPESEG